MLSVESFMALRSMHRLRSNKHVANLSDFFLAIETKSTCPAGQAAFVSVALVVTKLHLQTVQIQIKLYIVCQL